MKCLQCSRDYLLLDSADYGSSQSSSGRIPSRNVLWLQGDGVPLEA